MNQPLTSLHIPVVIFIISDPNERIIYRAFSPLQFTPINALHYDDSEQSTQQFINHIYTHLGTSTTEDNAVHGELSGVNDIIIYYSTTPIYQRGQTCYITTYTHPDCSYDIIYTQAGVIFNENELNQYDTSESDAIINRLNLEDNLDEQCSVTNLHYIPCIHQVM